MKVKKLGVGKSILLSVLVVFVVFSIIRIYHYQVLKKISDAGKAFIESENYNYIVRTVRKNSEEITKQYKNGKKIYSQSNYKDSTLNYESDYSSIEVLEEEFLNNYVTNNKENELTIYTYSEDTLYGATRPVNFSTYWVFDELLTFESTLLSKISNWIHYRIMYPAVFEKEFEGKECYVLNKFSTVRLWVDKETLLPVKEEYLENDGQVHQTTYYEYNKLSNEVIELPNPKDYKIVKYFDNGENWAKENTWKKPAEESISGTNLKPGEMLVENLEIKDNEILNFLELTPNEDGIVSLNIYSYDTYNKFRTKYSGLRELTEKDFERYFVSIAFKDGYRLNYLENWESSQANITNIIMDAQKVAKDNLTLLVRPKATGNMRVEYIENDRKIKIDSYTAVENIQEYLDNFAQKYNLKNMDFMGYNNDFICRLTNKKFAELDYIIKPVKGEEPICWRIDWCVYRGDADAQFSDLIIYIDATTGEVIGSKADY